MGRADTGAELCKLRDLPVGADVQHRSERCFRESHIVHAVWMLAFRNPYAISHSFSYTRFPSLRPPLTPEEPGKMHKQQDHTYFCRVQ